MNSCWLIDRKRLESIENHSSPDTAAHFRWGRWGCALWGKGKSSPSARHERPRRLDGVMSFTPKMTRVLRYHVRQRR